MHCNKNGELKMNQIAMNFGVQVSVFLFFVFVFLFRADLVAYGGSQARGPIGAVAAGLHQGHSKAGSEPHLQPTPQLMAMPDPQPTEQGQGSNPQPHCS